MLRGKICILLLITVFSVEESFGQDIPSELLECAAINDEKERLACYDREMTHLLLQTQQKSADVAATSAPKVSDSAMQGAAAVAVIPKMPPAQQSIDVSATAAATSTTDSSSESPIAESDSVAESASGAEISVAIASTQPDTVATVEQDFGIVNDQSSSLPGGLDELSANVTKIGTQPHGEFIVYLDNGQVWQQDFKTSSHFPFDPGDTVTIRKRRFGGYRIYNEAGDAFRMKRIR